MTGSPRKRARSLPGLGQLSLVEHALCPLDPKASLVENLAHETTYHFTDASRHLKSARAKIFCPLGLSAADEFFLWGLLALTFSDRDPDGELYATPHFCLRRLGVIDQHARRGGRQYRQFADAVDRLSAVSYRNDQFYDPVRAEHRRVSFGFLSYSLPLDPESSRAWRIAWDPIFFEFVRAAGGHLRFDLDTYRELDAAGRRLFLFVSKLFARRATTPTLDLKHLGVNMLGFAPSLVARDLKVKVGRTVRQLTERGILRLCDEPLFEKRGPGEYATVLHRGPYFERSRDGARSSRVEDSPLYDPLSKVGLDDGAIRRLVERYPSRVLREWADITLAAQERFGASFFRRSPQAYLVDNVRKAAQGERTPPDWWHELRRAERRRDEFSRKDGASAGATGSLAGETLGVFARVRDELAAAVGTGGARDAERRAVLEPVVPDERRKVGSLVRAGDLFK